MKLQHKEKITMRHSCILAIVALALFSNCENAFSQSNTFPWPTSGVIGIGTTAPKNALTLSFNSDIDTAIIRLTNDTSSVIYGIFGLMPFAYPYYSSLSTGEDLILHQNQSGDIIVTNYSIQPPTHGSGTAIRFATTGDTNVRPLTARVNHDLERMTIMGNGNVGIDLPPSSTGLDSVKDQLQIGGGVTPYPGNTYLSPGLTLYGGNRFENMTRPTTLGTGLFPGDWRYISFNHWIDHNDNTSSRSHRFQPIGSSAVNFAESDGGLLNFTCSPYDSTRGMSDFTHNISLQMTGNTGLSLWAYQDSSDVYHHLFEVLLPHVTPWPITRNTNGLFIHHTPVLITSDTTSTPSMDFQNLPIRPDLGDDTTWDLVVNGSALFKEAFVNTNDWPDNVFLPEYKLPPLAEVENFTKENHHLPDIPSAKEMAKTGVPVGRTEAALTKQLEEMMLYLVQQNHKIDTLEAEVQELKNQKEK
jgi:hypothetical protein